MNEIKYIRDCTEQEQQSTFALYLRSFAFYGLEYDQAAQQKLFAHLLDSDWFNGLIYFENSNALGFCFFHKSYSSIAAGEALRLEEIYIDTPVRQQSIGSKLLQQTLEHCKTNDIKKVVLNIHDDLTEVPQFYEKHGFKVERYRLFGKAI